MFEIKVRFINSESLGTVLHQTKESVSAKDAKLYVYKFVGNKPKVNSLAIANTPSGLKYVEILEVSPVEISMAKEIMAIVDYSESYYAQVAEAAMNDVRKKLEAKLKSRIKNVELLKAASTIEDAEVQQLAKHLESLNESYSTTTT